MSPELPWGRIGAVVHLSPHSDDAAFSSAGVLHACGLRGIPVRIVTCFSLSSYSRSATHGDAARNTEVRKAEDRRFAATLPGPVTLRWLDLPDAPLRPAHAGKHPCKEATMTPDDTALAASIESQVADDIDDATWVFAPLGLGRHIDHLVARDAGAAIARKGRARVAFWEDLPYAGRVAMDALEREIEGAMEAVGLRLEPRLLMDQGLEERRRAALGCYPSQVVDVHLHGVLAHVKRVSGTGAPAERVWMPVEASDRSAQPAPLE